MCRKHIVRHAIHTIYRPLPHASTTTGSTNLVSQRRHLALQRRLGRRVPPAGASGAAEATSTRRTSAQQPPSRRPSLGSQPPAAAAGFSNVSNALAACLSTAPARPVVHQPLIEQQVTLCRLAAGAARRSAAAACIEWCLHTTRPAAPEGRGSSTTGRMRKERPLGRSGRSRERRVHESALRGLTPLPWRETRATPAHTKAIPDVGD